MHLYIQREGSIFNYQLRCVNYLMSKLTYEKVSIFASSVRLSLSYKLTCWFNDQIEEPIVECHCVLSDVCIFRSNLWLDVWKL